MIDDEPWDLFDLPRGRRERDRALQQVTRENFMAHGIAAISALPSGRYLGEDVRQELTRQGIVPHHHNAWGALILNAVRQGLLTRNGEWLPLRTIRSHARLSAVYLR